MCSSPPWRDASGAPIAFVDTDGDTNRFELHDGALLYIPPGGAEQLICERLDYNSAEQSLIACGWTIGLPAVAEAGAVLGRLADLAELAGVPHSVPPAPPGEPPAGPAPQWRAGDAAWALYDGEWWECSVERVGMDGGYDVRWCATGEYSTGLTPGELAAHTPHCCSPPGAVAVGTPPGSPLTAAAGAGSSAATLPAAATPPLAPSDGRATLPPGRPSWRVGVRLGAGAFGTVHQVVDGRTGAQYAAKCLPRSRLDGLSAEERESVIASFEREVEMLTGLDHPNIVRYHGFARRPDGCYIVLEYVTGGSVVDLMRQLGGPLDERHTARVVEQALLGLRYLHGQGIIHRDIKGANLLLEVGGAVKIADFGCGSYAAAGSPSSRRRSGSAPAVGTVPFMAPEILSARTYSPASDVWAMGCVVCELLSGEPPFAALRAGAGDLHQFLRVVRDALEAGRTPLQCLPDGAAGADPADFASRCFAREPCARPCCDALLRTPFVTGAARSPGGGSDPGGRARSPETPHSGAWAGLSPLLRGPAGQRGGAPFSPGIRTASDFGTDVTGFGAAELSVHNTSVQAVRDAEDPCPVGKPCVGE